MMNPGMPQGMTDGAGGRMMQGANMGVMYGMGAAGQVGMTHGMSASMASGSGNIIHGNVTGSQGFMSGIGAGHSLPNGAFLLGAGDERLPSIPEEHGPQW
ncbi:MAG TPA: hypothetical protein VGO47_10235 [Chlamydiales bacterium]|jgi:hypothetical protein|nr:hypothetical protein [Chlamydiales bacterium]